MIVNDGAMKLVYDGEITVLVSVVPRKDLGSDS